MICHRMYGIYGPNLKSLIEFSKGMIAEAQANGDKWAEDHWTEVKWYQIGLIKRIAFAELKQF